MSIQVKIIISILIILSVGVFLYFKKDNVGENKVTATIIDGEVIVKNASGKILPGYNEMWFSWATQHQKDGFVWKK